MSSKFEDFLVLQGKSILIVDDCDEIRDFLSRALEILGCELEFAQDGEEAIAKVGQKTFDLVIMDIFMPVLDGSLAATCLRRIGYEKPIIAVTAALDYFHHRAPEEFGFSAWLPKPINRIELISLLGSLS